MAEKKEFTVTENNDIIYKAKGFWDKNSKPLIYIGAAIILLIAGWYGYKNLIQLPNEKKAAELIFPAEAIFDKMGSAKFTKDSVNTVLNGGDDQGTKVTGMLKIIKEYGGTKAGNRAKYMAGASYLHIGEFDKAIKYLKDFDGEGASQIKSKAYTMIGHAYAEQNKTDDALSYYKKAVRVNEKDEAITPDALMLAASYAEVLGKNKEAIDLYEELKNKYPSHIAVKSGDVSKYLAKLGVFKD